MEGIRAHSLEMIRDNVSLKLQEKPAMGKRLRKHEKLDLILSELAKLRGEVRKLVRDRAAVAEQDVKAKPRSAPGRAKKLPKPMGGEKRPDRDVAPSKPVLVETPRAPQPTSRTASQ
jgi:hypothetical protein